MCALDIERKVIDTYTDFWNNSNNFKTKMSCWCLRPSHTPFFLITVGLIIFTEEHKSWSPSLCNFIRSAVVFPLLSPNILLGCSSKIQSVRLSTPIEVPVVCLICRATSSFYSEEEFACKLSAPKPSTRTTRNSPIPICTQSPASIIDIWKREKKVILEEFTARPAKWWLKFSWV